MRSGSDRRTDDAFGDPVLTLSAAKEKHPPLRAFRAHDQSRRDTMTNETDTPIEVPAEPETEAPAAPDLVAIRQLVLRAHPEVVPELIAGESVEALLASVEPAEEAYRRLAERLGRAPATAPSVPAGGERPLPIDPDRLPASEKIRRGLARANR
jgi:hypothetical protein